MIAMTENEACHKIDQWLLIPVDYDQVLEPLSVLHDSDRFALYVAKVANAEFKSAQDVIHDVELYEARQSKKNSALDEKLNQISGGKIRSARYEAEEEDVLDVIARDKNGGDGDQKPLSSRYSSYVQNQMLNMKQPVNKSVSGGYHTSANGQPDGDGITVSCNHCHCAMEMRTNSKLTSYGKFFVVLALIFCFPLAIFPLILMREDSHYYVCRRCGRRHDI